ncbi:MAG: formylglycine-generating enzyme family protein [Steroidobacteraceae bacterium]
MIGASTGSLKRGLLLAVGLALLAAPAVAAHSRGKVAKVGEHIKDCRNCPELVVLPAGKFLMGSPMDEAERRDNEKQRQITIAHPFAMSATPVTWDQWEACARDRWCEDLAIEEALRLNRDGTVNAKYVDFGRGSRPAVGMSWYDAQKFVGWLNWKSGADDAYHLPSEAEWEYAARAGTTTAYPWGNTLDYRFGNFGKRGHELGGQVEGRDVWGDETSPVASFPPNAWGLYDMHGNVFEWTQDCLLADLSKAPTDGRANTQGDCTVRVFRSGTYMSNPYMHRSARRGAP